MAEFILFGIVVLALVTLYIRQKKGSTGLFDKICNAYLVFVSVHAIFMFITHRFSDFHAEIGFAAPFILAYASFFYIGLKSLDKSFSKRVTYIHFTPILIFTGLYVVLISNGDFLRHFLKPFYIIQYMLALISLIGYFFWTILHQGLKDEVHYKQRKQLIRTCGYALGIMGVLFTVAALSGSVSIDDLKPEVIGIVVYSGIFATVVFGFIFTINNLIGSKQPLVIIPANDYVEEARAKTFPEEEKSQEDVNIKKPILVQKYNKSALSPVMLNDYKDKLDRFINIEQVYLDNELTLEVLAKKMKIPMHHLTQLFNVYLGDNFNQYINRFRVEYACRLLLSNAGILSIEQIAFNSGFNSKVSFNRHFKNSIGCTPKEYILSRKSTDD